MCRCIAVLFVLVAVSSASAECIELKIVKREPFAGGMSFGDVGSYERIVGIAKFAIDPKHPRNAAIVDLDKAPRNKDGKVEFQSDLFILAPKDPAKGNGAILYDVNNRGLKLALSFFNDAPGSNDPSTVGHAGNGFLMRRGYTVVWSGWIGEVLPGYDRMLLQAPIATDNGKPITGVVRFEFGSDTAADSLPLSRREGLGSYNPTEKGEKEGVLTFRLRETDPRVPIERDQWTLQRIAPATVKDRVPGTLAQVRCKLKGGFRPGYIYELICECENPIVQGCGFAAVRDLVSFLKYDSTEKNPLVHEKQNTLKCAHGFGISQSGRFLRHLVYEQFNIDEAERKVFDGLMPHVAGGGLGFFNHRFAQPTRHNGQHEEHLYPADVFPFTYGDEKHRYFDLNGKVVEDDRVDGIQSKYRTRFLPCIMHTQSSSEYWNRSGSLVHTDPLGERDAAIPANVRIYSFGGTQHGPAPDPPTPGNGMNLPNPGNFKPICRALLVDLDDWVRDGKRPPDSEYPRVGRLFTDLKQSATSFPKIPGVRYPEVIQQPSFLDLGASFNETRVIAQEPPRIVGHYRVLVPVYSNTGSHELGMLDPPEVYVPVATHTGWNLRKKEIGAEGMLLSLQGSYIPLPRTKAEAEAKGDPRPSLEEHYGSFAEYLRSFKEVCTDYVQKRWLLPEDADQLIASRVLVHHLFADPKDSLLEPNSRMAKVAEGPAVDKDANLFFSDAANDRIMKLSSDGKLSEFRKPASRTNGMAFDREGRLLMCQSNGEGGGRRVTRLEKDGKETVLADVFDGKKFFAPNDVCVDAEGRIYFTDMNTSAKKDNDDLPSGVYRIDAPGKVVRIIDNLGRPNGLALSPDGKLLYVSDRGTQKLHSYKMKANGEVEADGIVYDFSPDRGIDGMRLDVKGNIWAAAGQGKTTGLFVVSPEGKLLLHHPVPEFSTNLCFGGKDNKDLYFTATTSVYRFRTTIAGVILPGRK